MSLYCLDRFCRTSKHSHLQSIATSRIAHRILFRRRRQRPQKKYQLRIILPCKRRHYRDYDLMIFI